MISPVVRDYVSMSRNLDVATCKMELGVIGGLTATQRTVVKEVAMALLLLVLQVRLTQIWYNCSRMKYFILKLMILSKH